jgi:hypothetical protein
VANAASGASSALRVLIRSAAITSKRARSAALTVTGTPSRMPAPASPANLARRRSQLFIAGKFKLAHKRARNIFTRKAFTVRVRNTREENVNGLIYLIGLIVVILFILSFLGLR